MHRKGLTVAVAAFVLYVLYLGVFLGWTHWSEDPRFLGYSLIVFTLLCLVVVGGVAFEARHMLKADRQRGRAGAVYRAAAPAFRQPIRHFGLTPSADDVAGQAHSRAATAHESAGGEDQAQDPRWGAAT